MIKIIIDRSSMTNAVFEAALKCHEAGQILQAQALYRGILAADPTHAGSLHLLGLITTEQGDPEAGAALILRAMARSPDQAPFHNSLGQAYRLLGRTEDALREYRTAAALRPHSAEIHNNLATLLRDAGRLPEAITHYRLAAEQAPGVADIWYNLANALADGSMPAETESSFLRALRLRPDFVNAHANFGRWLMTQARWADAEFHLTQAIRLQTAPTPDQASVWTNLGIVAQETGRIGDAEACYRQALLLDPVCAGAHHNLGSLLSARGRTDDAIAAHQAALAADPNYQAARLAACMAQLPIVYGSTAEIAVRRERYARALAALEASPDGLAPAIGTSQPFFLPYQGQDDRALQARYGALACRVLALSEPAAILASPPARGERIRVGIVSGFFRDHTVYKLFLEGWLAGFDRSRFEIIGFHTGPASDPCTARSAVRCDRFVTGPRSTAAWRDAIEAVAPHALLYPEVGMDPIAGRLAALRLAPVQCATWGQPETTGMPTIDAFLSSELMEPPDGANHYTERLMMLPDLALCYQPDPPASSSLDRAALGLDPDATVFWSGQALYKYLPEYDDIFPRIAAIVGTAQFVFIGFAKSAVVTEAFRTRLNAAFAAAGLDASRHVVILPPLSQDDFVASAGLADVVLDTPGWSGGKSTLDLLAVNPAIVTLPGRLMRGRHTTAILRHIGCTATIADSVDAYVALAVRLAREPDWRDDIRAAVAAGKARAFDSTRYITALESFLTEAVARSRPG